MNVSKMQNEGIGRLGIPISDDSSEDEASQIRALEEDRGIHHHEEVVVTPTFESDEDIPLTKPQSQVHDSNQDQEDEDDTFGIMERDTASRMERRRSVRFTGPYDQEEDGQNAHIRSPSPESLKYIKALENPMDVRDDDEKSQQEDDFEELVKGPIDPRPPIGSPPAYSSAPEDFQPKPATPSTNVDEVQSKKSRGTLNDLLISKVAQPFQNMMRRASRLEEDSDSDEEDDDDDFTEEEIQVLTYIDSYKPAEIELRTQLHPFLLPYVPAIGDIDAFLKVPRPDEVDDNVGLTHLDEPATQQSDATILNMQLRNFSKEVSSSMIDDPPVKLLERADKNSDEIEKWIGNIKELHKMRPAQTVHFKGAMPDIDTLMQEWPSKFEDLLRTVKLPTSDLDVDLSTFCDLCLNICDIPVGKSRIQSLYLMFSLLNEFNNSQHFRNLAQTNSHVEENLDRLEL